MRSVLLKIYLPCSLFNTLFSLSMSGQVIAILLCPMCYSGTVLVLIILGAIQRFSEQILDSQVIREIPSQKSFTILNSNANVSNR